MTYETYQIGQICSMVKGAYPTLNTEPGDYPLVVTAEHRRSASTYQLEGPTVCVPLISSTGHGDATLHRVHYQEGKFALANLLVALQPRDSKLCNAKYLYYHLTAKKNEYFVPLMSGTANVSLKMQDIAAVEIPLPSLEKQQRIVAHIEVLGAKIKDARELYQELIAGYTDLCRSYIFDKTNNDCIYIPMRELVRQKEPDIFTQPEEQYHFAGVYCFGKGMFQGQCRFGTEFAYNRLTRLLAGDFVYPKLMAWEGALAIVPPECDGLVVSPEFPVFEVNQERVLPETLDVYFRTPSVWPILSGVSTGTNVRRRRLSPSDFLVFKFPLPPMQKQEQLRRIKQKVDMLENAQAETSAELDAMLPSILDKAFKGVL